MRPLTTTLFTQHWCALVDSRISELEEEHAAVQAALKDTQAGSLQPPPLQPPTPAPAEAEHQEGNGNVAAEMASHLQAIRN
jgi:hypothetical protein